MATAYRKDADLRAAAEKGPILFMVTGEFAWFHAIRSSLRFAI
jgi:hypothetical protein